MPALGLGAGGTAVNAHACELSSLWGRGAAGVPWGSASTEDEWCLCSYPRRAARASIFFPSNPPSTLLGGPDGSYHPDLAFIDEETDSRRGKGACPRCRHQEMAQMSERLCLSGQVKAGKACPWGRRRSWQLPGFLAPGCRPDQLPCRKVAGGETLPRSTWKQ